MDGSLKLYQLKDGVGLVRARSTLGEATSASSAPNLKQRHADQGDKQVVRKSSRVMANIRRALKKGSSSGTALGPDRVAANNDLKITEMYKSLRDGASGDESSGEDSDAESVSLDAGGKPKPALLDTEARLRRAQKLLVKNTPDA